MAKHKWFFILLFSMLVSMIPFTTYAQSDLKGREEVFEFLEEAFHSQVSLSEQDRSLEEIKKVLHPYFTESYSSMFMEENVVGQENSYRTYGTDFAPYFIPFYAFTDKTKVVELEKEIYVLEYFPGNGEGPVSYDSHYEGLKLIKDQDGWKVADYLYDGIPEEVIKKAYPEKGKSNEVMAKIEQFNQNFAFGPNFSALKTFMEYGFNIGTERKMILFGYM